MRMCPSCGTENLDAARFCMACASPLAPDQLTAGEVRKTVTVLFADVTGSTSLGEQLDPESTRRIMRRYFDAMSAVLEKHGGTVEKFIGDAVMAVFGIPMLHEDDALRAVRAGLEMRAALDVLNGELERDHGITIQMRIGIDTGEVVAGDASTAQTMVTGDAVNVAARLEQNAKPGEILIGETTTRLVRDAVKAEQVDPLELKGKSEAVRAHRLLDIVNDPELITRRLHSPMVGRSRELMLLTLGLERAVEQDTCHLATVMGAAGVGKSRLVNEFLESARLNARVLTGRCLPYGEGITYWPVIQAVKEAAGITENEATSDATAKLSALLGDEDGADLIVRRVGQVIGLVGGNAVPEETFWAIRRFFEAIAKRQPLVLLFDDIHWAAPTFFELMENLTDLARDAALLVLCLGRQELLDVRPGWGGGKLNSTSILLEPLTERQCEQLIGNLLGRAELSEDMRRRIAEAAEGNPLFVEEMLSTLIDDGLLRHEGGSWIPAGDLSNVKVPPTIHALLAARLDRLDPEERAVIARASVVGRTFYRGALISLSPEVDETAIDAHLTSLVRRELIRPQHSDFAGEESYRFRHIMIRDAVYDAVPKETRAELHEQFADWLAAAAPERVREFAEIIGYHLERAHRYRAELGPLDAHGKELATRAGGLLAPAGLRALDRGDATGASNLLHRAVSLLDPSDPQRTALIPELASVLMDLGRFEEARTMLSEPIPLAGEASQRAAGVRARLVNIYLRVRTELDVPYEKGVVEAAELVSTAREIGDLETFLIAERTLAHMRIWTGDSAGAIAALDEALAAAGSMEATAQVLDIYRVLNTALVWGAAPVQDAIARWNTAFERHPSAATEAFGWFSLAALHAMSGNEREARDYLDRSLVRLEQLGQKIARATRHSAFFVHLLAGDAKSAADALRPGIAELAAVGEVGYLSTSEALLAEALYWQGEYAESAQWIKKAHDIAAPDDVLTQMLLRSTEAKVLADRGQGARAEQLARESIAIAESTDYLNETGNAYLGLGIVLRAGGRADEARAAFEKARALYEQKGNVVLAARAVEMAR